MNSEQKKCIEIHQKNVLKAAAIKRTSQRCSRQCLYSSLPLKHREKVFLAVNVKKKVVAKVMVVRPANVC